MKIIFTKRLIKENHAVKNEGNIFTVFSATTRGVFICSFTSVVGAPVGIASESFTLIFSLTTEINKKLLSITRKKRKKKHDKIPMLAKSKLKSIETLISQVMTDMEISYEEYIAILKEEDKYEKMKENLRSENEKQ